MKNTLCIASARVTVIRSNTGLFSGKKVCHPDASQQKEMKEKVLK